MPRSPMRRRIQAANSRRVLFDRAILAMGVSIILVLASLQMRTESQPRAFVLQTPKPTQVASGGSAERLQQIRDSIKSSEAKQAWEQKTRLTTVSVSTLDASSIFGTAFSPWADGSLIKAFPPQDVDRIRRALDPTSDVMSTPVSTFFPSALYERLRRRYERAEATLPRHPFLDSAFYGLWTDYFYQKHRLSPLRSILSGKHLHDELVFLRGLAANGSAVQPGGGAAAVSIAGRNLTLPHSFLERLPGKRYVFDPTEDLDTVVTQLRGGGSSSTGFSTKQFRSSRSGQRPSPLTCYEGDISPGVPGEAPGGFWKAWLDFALQRSMSGVLQGGSAAHHPGDAQTRSSLSQEQLVEALQGEENLALNVNVFSVMVGLLHDAAVVHLLEEAFPGWDLARRGVCEENFKNSRNILAEFVKTQLEDHSDIVVVSNPPHTLFSGGNIPQTIAGYSVHTHACHTKRLPMCTAPIVLTRDAAFEGAIAVSKQISSESLLLIATLRGSDEEGQLVLHAMADDFLHETSPTFKGAKDPESLARAVAGRHPNRRLISITPPGAMTVFDHDFFVESTAKITPQGVGAFFLPTLSRAARPREMLSVDSDLASRPAVMGPEEQFPDHAFLTTGFDLDSASEPTAARSAVIIQKVFGLWRDRGGENLRKQKSSLLANIFTEAESAEETDPQDLAQSPQDGTGIAFKDGRGFVRHISGAQGCGKAAVKRGLALLISEQLYGGVKSRVCAVALPGNGSPERANHFTTSAGGAAPASGDGRRHISLLFQQQRAGGRAGEWSTVVTSHGVIANGMLLRYTRVSPAKAAAGGGGGGGGSGGVIAEAEDPRFSARYVVSIEGSGVADGEDLFTAFGISVTSYYPEAAANPSSSTSAARGGAGGGAPPLATPNTKLWALEVELTFDPPPAEAEFAAAPSKHVAAEEEAADAAQELSSSSPFLWAPLEMRRGGGGGGGGDTSTSRFFSPEESFRSPCVLGAWRSRAFAAVPSLRLIEQQQRGGAASLPHTLDIAPPRWGATIPGMPDTAGGPAASPLGRAAPLHPRLGVAAVAPGGGLSRGGSGDGLLYVPPPHSGVPLFSFTLSISAAAGPAQLLSHAAGMTWGRAAHSATTPAASTPFRKLAEELLTQADSSGGTLPLSDYLDATAPPPPSGSAAGGTAGGEGDAPTATTAPGLSASDAGRASLPKVLRVNGGEPDRAASGFVRHVVQSEADEMGLTSHGFGAGGAYHPVSHFAVAENNAFMAFGRLYWEQKSSGGGSAPGRGDEALRLLMSASADAASLFLTAFAWERERWVVPAEDSRRFVSADVGATVFWLHHLHLHFPAALRGFFAKPAYGARAKTLSITTLAVFLSSVQRDDGSIPLYFDSELSPTEKAGDCGDPSIYTTCGSTAIGGAVMAIAANPDFAESASLPGQAPLEKASRDELSRAAVKAAQFVERSLLTGLQARSRQPVGVLVWMGWQALYVHRLTGQWLGGVERIASLIGLQQQAWAPPRMGGGDPFGGFSPSARSAARSASAYAAVFFADTYVVTRVEAHLHRAIAAARALFSFIEGRSGLGPRDSTLLANASSAAAGGDAGAWSLDPSPQEGWGGALAAAAYLLSLFGDILIEPELQAMYAIDALKAEASFEGVAKATVTISSPEARVYRVRFIPPPKEGYVLVVNGKSIPVTGSEGIVTL